MKKVGDAVKGEVTIGDVAKGKQ